MKRSREYYERNGVYSEKIFQEKKVVQWLRKINGELFCCAQSTTIGRERLKWFTTLRETDCSQYNEIPAALINARDAILELVESHFDEMKAAQNVYWLNHYTLSKAGVEKTLKLYGVISNELWTIPPIDKQEYEK